MQCATQLRACSGQTLRPYSSRPRKTACTPLSATKQSERPTEHLELQHQLQQQQQPVPSETTSTVASLIAQPVTCISALAGFALIASNIALTSTSDPLQSLPESLSAQSTMQQLLANSGAAQAASLSATDQAQPALEPILSNPILQLDDTIHQYVAAHTTESFRLWADVWISDAFITAGVLGWAACTAACLVKAPAKSAGPLAAAWGFYFATCGAIKHWDPLLVDSLKHLFARARPSTLHHTFSFPSGHTSAAVFVVGALLTVLLPLTLQLWASSSTVSSSTVSSSTAPGSSETQYSSDSSSNTEGSATAGILAADVAVLAVWGAAWATTATGRILSESHWLSDTLAGGFLAIASVSGLALTTRLVQEWQADISNRLASQSTAGNTSAQGDS